MSEARKIQCPSCGSNSTYKLFDGNYKCNYCQSNFIVTDTGGTASRTTQRTPTTPATSVADTASAAKKKMIMAVAIAFLTFGIGISVFMARMITSPVENGNSISTDPADQPVVKMTTAFIGSRGPAIWIVSETHTAGNKAGSRLQVVDPQKNRLMTEQAFDEKAGNRFVLYGDIAYTISDDKKLTGYDLYTGLVKVTNESLAAQFPELKAGILKTEDVPSTHRFKLTTTTGDVFNYDPGLQKLSSKEDEMHSKKRKDLPVTTELYVSDGLKHQLYKLTKQGDGFPIVFNGYVQEGLISRAIGSKGNNVEDIFGNKRIEKVSEKNYFRAQPLVKGEDQSMVLLYKTDLSDKGATVLESVNAGGKTNWTLKDPLFSKIGNAFASEDLGGEFTYSKEVLILKIPSGDMIYMGIDLKMGKILWTFNATKYLQERH